MEGEGGGIFSLDVSILEIYIEQKRWNRGDQTLESPLGFPRRFLVFVLFCFCSVKIQEKQIGPASVRDRHLNADSSPHRSTSEERLLCYKKSYGWALGATWGRQKVGGAKQLYHFTSFPCSVTVDEGSTT